MNRLEILGLMAVLFGSSACSEPLTIATWINLQEDSLLTTDFLGSEETVALDGGAFVRIELGIDPHDPLKVQGTIDVEQVRMGGKSPLLGNLCIRKDIDNPVLGSFSFDLLQFEQDVEFPFAVVASSSTLELLGLPEIALEASPEGLELPITPELVEATVLRGTVDGALELPVQLESDLEIAPGLVVNGMLDLLLLSSATPPAVSPELAAACEQKWAIQGREIDYVINPKSTYLRTVLDETQPTIVVALADLGAAPGDVLKLRRKGAFKQGGVLWDGERVAGVFSGSDILLDEGTRNRVLHAIDAGSDVWTPRTQWFWRRTDIPQDFEIPSQPIFVQVPFGATHLFFTPIDDYFSDNYSFELRVGIEVNPD